MQQGDSTNNKITGIVDQLRSRTKALTVEQLADKLEVSAKTIYKSISKRIAARDAYRFRAAVGPRSGGGVAGGSDNWPD